MYSYVKEETKASKSYIPYGAPRQTCVAKAGTNIAHRFVKLGLAIDDSGPRNLAMKPFFSSTSFDFRDKLELRHLLEMLPVNCVTGLKVFLQIPVRSIRAIVNLARLLI